MFERKILFKYTKLSSSVDQTVKFYLKRHAFSFIGKTRYIVYFEEHEHEIFAIKFFLAKDKNLESKYSTISGLNEFQRLINTVAEILLKEILHYNQYASFFFKGMEADGENADMTKRYRVYKKVIMQAVGGINFNHFCYDKQSIYFFQNRCIEDPDFLSKGQKILKDYYFIDV